MSVNLSLLPFDHETSNSTFAFSQTVLTCEQDSTLFSLVEGLTIGEVPEQFNSYVSREHGEESHYGVTRTDNYGDVVQYTTVRRLLELRAHPGVAERQKNRAIWAYLAALPPETKVALWWD